MCFAFKGTYPITGQEGRQLFFCFLPGEKVEGPLTPSPTMEKKVDGVRLSPQFVPDF